MPQSDGSGRWGGDVLRGSFYSQGFLVPAPPEGVGGVRVDPGRAEAGVTTLLSNKED